MLFNPLLGGACITGLAGLVAYLKLRTKKEQTPSLMYNVAEYPEYYTSTHKYARVYNYHVMYGKHKDLERAYAESLFGNPKMKEYVDLTLQDYLKTKNINQHRVVINTIDWVADIEIETNTNSNTLVFSISNNSLVEAKYGWIKVIIE